MEEEFRKRAHRVECGPGDGAYMPSTSPHLVEVGNDPSVTISFTYYTDSTRRQNLLHYVRGHLAERGIDFPPVGQHKFLDQLVYHSALPIRETMRAIRHLTGKQIFSDKDKYAHHKFS